MGAYAYADSSDVQTFTDQAVAPPPAPAVDQPVNQPLKAGSLKFEDVLQADRLRSKSQAGQTNVLTAPASSGTTPGLSPASGGSSESVMLMQGMKSALQQSGMDSGPIKSPAFPANAAASGAPTAITPPADSTAAVPGVKYEPGQAPKNLDSGMAPAVAIAPLPSVKPMTPDATAASPQIVNTETAVSDGNCQPHIESWVKKCADAGYPDSFAGQINGETRTICPGGTLKDVWVSNTCAPPGSTPSNAPLSGPSVNVPSSTMPLPNPSIRNDGSCGTANGLAANVAPTTDLCAMGDATDIQGSGPWRWSCKGFQGGMTVSCAAPVATAPATTMAPQASASAPALVVEDGQCGASDGMVTDHAPYGDLCIKGAASRVSGSGPWTWACSGMNGGQAVSCTAAAAMNGTCGAAVSRSADSMPMTDLCATGYASAVTGNGPWNWTCSGSNGGGAATCTAAPKQDAVCGQATQGGRHDMPHENLCSVGAASDVSGHGPWSWNCTGSNGGSSVSCTAAAAQNGSCGTANGIAASEAPADNLCNHGIASRVSGLGPWNWTCSGSDGGDTESCTAPVAPRAASAAAASSSSNTGVVPTEKSGAAPAANDNSSSAASMSITAKTSMANMCGTASEAAALQAPTSDLCNGNTKASDVSGEGPWTWSCSDDNGHSANCSTLAPSGSLSDAAAAAKEEAPAPKPAPAKPVALAAEKATCGSSANVNTPTMPSSGLCETGKASAVSGNGPWNWTCTKGKTKASCSATKVADGVCGPANGAIKTSSPIAGLCSSGTPTETQGNGPWLWTCVGTGGGASVSCSASAQAQTRVDGTCGSAATETTTTTPSTSLCDSGTPSNVYGDGPWTWTCSGMNGGIASSCSTQRNVPPAPPPPGPALNGLCGSSNGVAMIAQPSDGLCTAGTSTGISGNGPWNWSCIGENGGMSVSCTAPMQPPAPITGACGASNGVPTLTQPRSALCSAGISSAVSGKGPWTWSCSGTNGGGAVGCVAPLAGGNGGSLPSITTPGSSDNAPQYVPAPTSNTGLVTPRLPKGPLPPMDTETMPDLTPSSPMPNPPEASALPPVPAPGSAPSAPSFAPDLPAGTSDVPPPSVAIPPTLALQSPETTENNAIPGNHFTLDEDISSISFTRGSGNIDNSVTPALNKLADVLQVNGGIRITLTAYATNAGSTPRDARRLSLQRALAVRDYLTAKGIASSRIDVRALGSNTSHGDFDRVDITTN